MKIATVRVLFILFAVPFQFANAFPISSAKSTAPVAVDPADYPVVSLAANLFADDVQRVTGRRPALSGTASYVPDMIIAGTIGHSAWIDKLAAEGKLKDLDKIKGRWEATLTQVLDNPFPGVSRALVIAGSDRRGAAYGLMRLSEEIGVSPWYWWADVPVPRRDDVTVDISSPAVDAPGVKYRGIFINDEDWGINPWASKTYDPGFGNIGPKTYARVFELMLRLRLDYIWPAMHACTREFGSVPENYALADQYGIVAGASHCEPMLYNNVHWNQQTSGPWNYSLNRDAIRHAWEESVKARGADEAVWTLGIRGIHDAKMEEPPRDIPGKIKLMTQVLTDQVDLLGQYVSKAWGPVSKCFVPYKEVQAMYDAGLSVPPDVTLVWADDNFGYIRRLSSPQERLRPGGAGVYWHISYLGAPHAYTWINTTAPALMWEELHKAWENDARNMWVLNVGDIKPMEAGIDYFSRLAWNPGAQGPDSQTLFLNAFAERTFGATSAKPITTLLADFYRLGAIRKPELMNREWALSLSPEEAASLSRSYNALLKADSQTAAALSPASRDAYTEMIGFPARVLGVAGSIFLADREIQLGHDPAANAGEIARLRAALEAQVREFNTKIAGGKWNRMMPGLQTGKDLTRWSSQVRWPWGEKTQQPPAQNTSFPPGPATALQPPRTWRDADSTDGQQAQGAARWVPIAGLGSTGRAMALEPASLASSWSQGDSHAPTLEYRFQASPGASDALVDFLPTFCIYPGMRLRVAVAVDDQPPVVVEVPGSNSEATETGSLRSQAVQDNFARARVPLPHLAPGAHLFTIRAIDPGVVIDRISLR